MNRGNVNENNDLLKMYIWELEKRLDENDQKLLEMIKKLQEEIRLLKEAK
jgi:hypothetical protein